MHIRILKESDADAYRKLWCVHCNQPRGICPIIKREVKFTTETVKKPLASTE